MKVPIAVASTWSTRRTCSSDTSPASSGRFARTAAPPARTPLHEALRAERRRLRLTRRVRPHVLQRQQRLHRRQQGRPRARAARSPAACAARPPSESHPPASARTGPRATMGAWSSVQSRGKPYPRRHGAHHAASHAQQVCTGVVGVAALRLAAAEQRGHLADGDDDRVLSAGETQKARMN